MATSKQIIESRLFQMNKKIESIEKHISTTQVYIDGLKIDYLAAQKAWRTIRDEITED